MKGATVPLLDDLRGVERPHRRVDSAVPDRQLGATVPGMRRGRSDQVAPFRGRVDQCAWAWPGPFGRGHGPRLPAPRLARCYRPGGHRDLPSPGWATVSPCTRAAAKRSRAALPFGHAAECLRQVHGTPVGQACQNGATDEQLRIGRERHRGHCPSGRQAGDVDAPAIDAVVQDHPLDHVADRQRLAAAALAVLGCEPGEAAVRARPKRR